MGAPHPENFSPIDPLSPRAAGELAEAPDLPAGGASGDQPPPALPDMASAPLVPLLGAEEVAAIFRVSGRTLRRWDRRGLLKPVRVGRSIRYRREDVARLIAREMIAAARRP